MTNEEALKRAMSDAVNSVIEGMDGSAAGYHKRILAHLAILGFSVVPADHASLEWRKGYGFGYEAARAVSEIGRSP